MELRRTERQSWLLQPRQLRRLRMLSSRLVERLQVHPTCCVVRTCSRKTWWLGGWVKVEKLSARIAFDAKLDLLARLGAGTSSMPLLSSKPFTGRTQDMVEGTQPIEHNDATATVASSNTGLCPSLGQALQRVRYTAAPLVSSSSSEAALKAEPLSVAVPPCSVPFIFAHRQWRAGLLMADAIQQGAFPVTGKRVLELGAGTALPSLASWRKGAGFVRLDSFEN